MTINPKANVFIQLRNKFNSNFEEWFKEKVTDLENIEIKLRAVAVLGQIISEDSELDPYRKEISMMFDEVFSDIVISIYFATCSLDKPAQIQLRRALELGITIPYLWDSPIEYCGWKSHDQDLSFAEMVDQLSKQKVMTFIKSINPAFNKDSLFNQTETKKLYRVLSNTMHGKMHTFESLLPDRFSYNGKDWESHIELVEKVINILFELWENRFFKYIDQLQKMITY